MTGRDDSSALSISLADFDNSSFSRGRSGLVEALWLITQWTLVSSWLPGSAHRRWLLRLFGAHVGKGVRIKPRVRVKFPWRLSLGDNTWLGEGVWIDNLVEIKIGANCCISQDAYLCSGSHDWTKPSFDLVTKPVRIEDESWVCSRATVAPGVKAGRGSVLAMASLAATDLQPWTVYQGVPARPLCSRQKRSGKKSM